MNTDAKKLLDDLRDAPYMVKVEMNGQTWVDVLLGDLPDHTDLQERVQMLEEEGMVQDMGDGYVLVLVAGDG